MPGKRIISPVLGARENAGLVNSLQPEETLAVELTPLAKQMLRAEKNNKFPCLLALDGIDAGSVFKIETSSVTVGRGPECDIVLRDDSISRQHAKISIIGPRRLVVEDLSSKNGTFVGGKSVSRATLRVGEKILFGRRTMLRFVLDDSLDLLYEHELSASKNRDTLTGIYNRKYLRQSLESQLSFARRHRLPLSVLSLGIDQLVESNQQHGYHTGDQMLVTLSRTVGEIIRIEDVFGRYSGQVFMIITQGIDREGGVSFAQRVRTRIATARIRALDGSDLEIQMSLSVGIVTVSGSEVADVKSVLNAAIHNLRLAKEQGGDTVVATDLSLDGDHSLSEGT